MMRDTLLVVERLALVRDALVAVLAGSRAGREGGSAVRCTGSLAEMTEWLAQDRGGVLLIDLTLTDGPAGLQPIRARFPAWHIVALDERETRDGILACLAAGAHGYVAKTEAAAELVRAVEVVEQGGVHVPPSLALAEPHPAGRAAPVPAPQPGVPPPTHYLTGRQRDVLRLMAEGRSTKDIARSLDLAVSTIKVHLAAVYRAVGARNRVEALCRAGLLLS